MDITELDCVDSVPALSRKKQNIGGHLASVPRYGMVLKEAIEVMFLRFRGQAQNVPTLPLPQAASLPERSAAGAEDDSEGQQESASWTCKLMAAENSGPMRMLHDVARSSA